MIHGLEHRQRAYTPAYVQQHSVKWAWTTTFTMCSAFYLCNPLLHGSILIYQPWKNERLSWPSWLAYKGKGLDTCYSATYISQTRDQQRFTISEEAADWPALTDNWTNGAASRHTIAPISHTKPSPRSRSYYSFLVPLMVGG